MDDFKKRVSLIKKIETETDSTLINLVYNTTASRLKTQIASDILDSLNMLLKSIPERKKKKISLILHSQGGFLDVITSFVYMIKKHFKEFSIIVPEIAHSAATILCLGADQILMSYFSSLSPFDPQLTLKTQSGRIGAGIEDIKGYYSLIDNLFTDDMAKIQAFNILSSRFPPEVLGNMERVQKQVKKVAFKVLSYQNYKEDRIASIINKFQTEFFSHQDRIHYDDAKQLGLNVKLMNNNLEDLSLELLSYYKQDVGDDSDLEIDIPDEHDHVEISINRSYLECKFSSFSYKTKYRIFKDKRVEVKNLGWQKNSYFDNQKGEEK